MAKASDFFGGGGSNSHDSLMAKEFSVGSHTYTIPEGVTKVYIMAIGGGGGGATQQIASGAEARGGGGGGFAAGVFDVSPGANLNLIVGGKGSRATYTNAFGGDGGTSSVTGSGIALMATGGTGGRYGSNTPIAAPGGTGSGGQINFTGGAGGTTVSTSGFSASGGGGAASPLGDGGHGGNITQSSGIQRTNGGGPAGLSIPDGASSNTTVNLDRHETTVPVQTHPGFLGSPPHHARRTDGNLSFYRVDHYGLMGSLTTSPSGLFGGHGNCGDGGNGYFAVEGGIGSGGGGSAGVSSNARGGFGGEGIVVIVHKYIPIFDL